MRIRGLTLAAVFVVLVACAEKARPPETVTTTPPVVTVQPSPPPRLEQPPPPPPPVPSPPRAVTPSPAGPAPSPAPPPSERSAATSVLYISVQRANFREGPDVKAKILSVLTKGTKLAVLEKSAQWFRVRLEDGKEGWVAESVTSAKPD